MSTLSSTDQKESMGRRLGLIRKELGFTQNQMAISLEISHRAYTNYERGEREIPAGLLVRILNKYKYDPVWILEGRNVQPQIVSHRKFDAELMSDVFCLISDWLEKRKKRLPTKDLIDTVSLAYEICASEGRADSEKISTIIKFAA